MTDTLPPASSVEAVLERYAAADADEREKIRKVTVGHVFVLMAGPAAEARSIGRPFDRLDRSGREGAASDISVASYLLGPFSDNRRNLFATISTMSAFADDLFADSAVWDAVTAVAEAALSGIEEGSALTSLAMRFLPEELPGAQLLRDSDGIGSAQPI